MSDWSGVSFRFNLPTKVVFGRGTSGEVAKEALSLGIRVPVLVTTAGGSLRRHGHIDRVEKVLKRCFQDVKVFDRVTTNPTTDLVDELVNYIRVEGADGLVALGGGSAIDTAKAASLVFMGGGRTKDYLLGVRKGKEALPLIAMPTTHGTGTEVNKYAVVTDPELSAKVAIVSRHIYPKVAIVDPSFMDTLPPSLSGATTFDALAHALESYLSKSVNPLSEMFALEAIKQIAWVYKGMKDGSLSWESPGVRDRLAWASTAAGIAIDQSRTGILHALEHALSAFNPELHHGLGLAMLAAAWAKVIERKVPDRVSEIVKVFGGSKPDHFHELISDVIHVFGLEKSLKEYGFEEEDVDDIIENARTYLGALLSNVPGGVGDEELRFIVTESILGR